MWFHVWFSNSFVLRIKNNQINLIELFLLGISVSIHFEKRNLKPIKCFYKFFNK